MERLTGRRDASVVVVGAGVAGLAAAEALRRGGASVTVVEAAGRIGGRAWTSTPAELQHPFDHGASWLHAADRNPLVAMARRLGETLVDTEVTRIRQTRRGGAEVTGDPGYDACRNGVPARGRPAPGAAGRHQPRRGRGAGRAGAVAAIGVELGGPGDRRRRLAPRSACATGTPTCCWAPTWRCPAGWARSSPGVWRPRPGRCGWDGGDGDHLGCRPACGWRRRPAPLPPMPASSPCPPACCGPARSGSRRRCRARCSRRCNTCRWGC